MEIKSLSPYLLTLDILPGRVECSYTAKSIVVLKFTNIGLLKQRRNKEVVTITHYIMGRITELQRGVVAGLKVR
jgi:hypothetical protein